MSAFLGPIHYWLYNKIQQQQAIVKDIYELGKQYGLSLQEDSEAKFDAFETKPLEEMIDQGNIHGWLQEKVSQVEYHYAFAVTTLLKKDQNALEELKQILYQKGKEIGQSIIDQNFTAPRIYQLISDNLLDGMPCDHANSIVEQSDQEVIWKRNLCVHSPYWDEVDGDINIYYELRDSWMEGLTEGCNYNFRKIDDTTYSIYK